MMHAEPVVASDGHQNLTVKCRTGKFGMTHNIMLIAACKSEACQVNARTCTRAVD